MISDTTLLVRKIIIGLFALIGAVASLVTVLDWLGKPEADVRATATLSTVAVPSRLTRALNPDSLFLAWSRRLTPDTVGRRGIERSSPAFDLGSGVIITTHPASMAYLELTSTAGLWTIALENSGTQRASDVRLTVQGARDACLFRPDSEEVCVRSSTLRVGDLQPLEKVRIHVWTASPDESASIQVTHAEGVGTVTKLIPFNAAWAERLKLAGYMLEALVAIVLPVIILFGAGYLVASAWLRYRAKQGTGGAATN